ncbi:MAG: glycoside hydrolase family 172 protein [Verrucomicrobiae bacterium]|nr:glycoside hydrolase family 172 protein [Verrucomicrobiae bacterium]
MNTPFNGLGMNLGNLSRLSKAQTRSICMENITGEKGQGGRPTEGTGKACARDLGPGWKVSPSVIIKAGETITLADIKGSGAIQHIWITGGFGREFILRMYWDDQDVPSVEAPLQDFFASPWKQEGWEINCVPETIAPLINSLPVSVNPKNAFNCYWEMPFRKRALITLENRHPSKDRVCYYQIDYTLTDVPEDCAYFHAQFRRTNPLPYKDVYTIIDGIKGRGQYVGTSMGWQPNNNGWWGEGEIKFYMDCDTDFPTICGTGTEDYFCGAWNWDIGGQYTNYSTPYAGMQIIKPDGTYRSQTRFQMYRWHIMDPIRFEQDLKVTIQALAWREGGRYLPMRDDICSTAFWYQTLPAAPFPKLGSVDELEII